MLGERHKRSSLLASQLSSPNLHMLDFFPTKIQLNAILACVKVRYRTIGHGLTSGK